MIEWFKEWLIDWFFDEPYEMNCEECDKLPWSLKKQAD